MATKMLAKVDCAICGADIPVADVLFEEDVYWCQDCYAEYCEQRAQQMADD